MGAEEIVQKLARPAIELLMNAAPVIIGVSRKCYQFYKALPIVYVQLIIGAVLCFFGGLYPALFAALQAAEHSGLSTVRRSLSVLSNEVLTIIEASKKDDKVDADGDGIPDAKQIEGRELVKRKFKLVLTKMDPEKVNAAIASIYKVWLSVLAVLTIQFARTIALALTISDFVKKMTDRLVLPIVRRATPKDYQKWCPVLIDWFTKGIGVSIAWRIQEVISAFTSACAGGLIMARALLHIVTKGNKDHEDTKMDELASFAFAAAGFYFQFYVGFDAPFPLNWILWPFEIAEVWIRWSVTNAAS